VSGETFPDQRALCFRDRQPVLIGDDSIPEGTDVANLVFRRKVVETRRRNRKSVCHVERIASDRGLDNGTKRQRFRRPPNVPLFSCGRISKTEMPHVAMTAPVVLHHGREKRRCKQQRGAAVCCNSLLGGDRNKTREACTRVLLGSVGLGA
jgi:hypothetical protein